MSVSTSQLPASASPSTRRAGLLRSSIGGKALMAVSGIALFGFVIAHLSGNLLVFAGRDAVNAYAVGLRELGPLLWVMRGGLLAFALLHVVVALRLWRQNRAARPVRYARHASIQTGVPARSMVLTGLLLLAYVLYHLAHLTWGLTHPEHAAMVDDQGRHDVYAMLVLGFRQPLVAGLYVVAMVLLFLHLSHGLGSLLQSLGLRPRPWHEPIRRGALALAALIALAYIAIPVSVLAGIVTLDGVPR